MTTSSERLRSVREGSATKSSQETDPRRSSQETDQKKSSRERDPKKSALNTSYSSEELLFQAASSLQGLEGRITKIFETINYRKTKNI